MLLLAKKKLDQEKRTVMYREMQEIAGDDGGTIIPMFTNFAYARSDNVKHTGQLAGSWQCGGARGWSRLRFTLTLVSRN